MKIMLGIRVKPGKCRGVSRISGKGLHMFKSVGVRFADFKSSLKYPLKMK